MFTFVLLMRVIISVAASLGECARSCREGQSSITFAPFFKLSVPINFTLKVLMIAIIGTYVGDKTDIRGLDHINIRVK
jgi:hypothetical protein